MNTKHTPGPWKVEGRKVTGPVQPWPFQVGQTPKVGASVVARVAWPTEFGGRYDEYPEDVARRNLELIAAAPDMLAALRDIEACTDMNLDCLEPDSCEVLERIRAILARIDGAAR